MNSRFHINPFVHEQGNSITTPENAADSPLSGDEITVNRTPSPKKSRRSVQKRVVSVPISDIDGSRSKGEVYPPSDSWAWRKYGQKPIKGSPYPRGYYRCSSSKGCPARKQVERSREDPTMLLITYFCEHNHTTLPTAAAAKHHHNTTSKIPSEEFAVLAGQTDLEPDNKSLGELIGGELGWFSNVASTILESPIFVGPACSDAQVAIELSMGEEDEALFADLGELPECSVVFRRSDEHLRPCSVETPCCNSTG